METLDILFLITVAINTALNNYLITFFKDTSFVLNLIAKIGHLFCVIISIKTLGIIGGIIFFVLYFLNLIYACYSWILLLPKTIIDMKKEYNKPSILLLYLFFFTVIALLVLCILYLVRVDSKTLLSFIVDYDYKPVIIFGISGVIGFILRSIIFGFFSNKQ